MGNKPNDRTSSNKNNTSRPRTNESVYEKRKKSRDDMKMQHYSSCLIFIAPSCMCVPFFFDWGEELPRKINALTGTTLIMQPCCQPTLPLVSHQTDLGFRRAQNPNSIHEPNGNLWQWKQIWNWDYVSKGIVKVWISWRKGCPRIDSRFSSTSHSADKADVLCTSN